jgi:hypothetical protein
VAALLLASGAALLSAGCGSGKQATPAGLRLQREDFITTARALSESRAQIDRETTATKVAWRAIANGVPATPSAQTLASIQAAGRLAAALKLPRAFQEQSLQALTGPGAGIAGQFRNSVLLADRGWRLIEYAIETERQGSTGAASFARTNVNLYVESIYDAHFGFAQLGKKLIAGYGKLGGSGEFGKALSEGEVTRLADEYSEARYRLHPHTGVKFGS